MTLTNTISGQRSSQFDVHRHPTCFYKEQGIDNKERVRILVVDDDPGYVRLIQTNLKAEGYEVLVARDGQTAIAHTVNREPDLVVLASGMLDLDGYDVCRRIREFSTVPIIMLIALAGTDYRVRGLRMGADQCVTKPIYVSELVVRIQAVLRRVAIFEQKGYHFVFQDANTSDDSDQRLFAKD